MSNDYFNSSEFMCKCGNQKGWITDGQLHKEPCPICHRYYRGQYNAKTLGIDAIETDAEGVDVKVDGRAKSWLKRKLAKGLTK